MVRYGSKLLNHNGTLTSLLFIASFGLVAHIKQTHKEVGNAKNEA